MTSLAGTQVFGVGSIYLPDRVENEELTET
jgi:hypothetical protein